MAARAISEEAPMSAAVEKALGIVDGNCEERK